MPSEEEMAHRNGLSSLSEMPQMQAPASLSLPGLLETWRVVRGRESGMAHNMLIHSVSASNQTLNP